MKGMFGADFRRVDQREYQGKPAVVVVAVRSYPTSVEDLWNAVTKPDRLARWFSTVEGDLKLGGRYRIKGNAEGTITRCDEPQALDLTWEFGGGTSWVTVRLAARGEATQLTLEHIVRASDADEHWKTYGPGAVGVGWDLSLVGLGLHLESGGSFDPQAGMAWAASDEGKRFMRTSAAAWADAHIAGGEDEAVARGMADRTAAFYTGG